MVVESVVGDRRLRQLLGPASVLLHPLYGLGLLLLAIVPLLAIASQPGGVLLAALSTYLLLMAVRLEEPWLALTPLPPLTILCLGAWIRSGLGGLLLALGKPLAFGERNSAYWEHLVPAQALWVVFMSVALTVFYCWPASKEMAADAANNIQKANKKSILNITIVCGIFAITSIGIGVLFGTLDRTPSSYLQWVAQRWRPDSFFTMFARLRDVFFLLAPLAIFRATRKTQRILLLSMLLGYIALALPMGGRGLLLYPILYAAIGIWLTPISTRILRVIIIGIFVFMLIAIPSIEIYRESAAFQTVSRGNIGKRIDLIWKATTKVSKDIKLTKSFTQAGISLYACSDGYLFQEPAYSRPRAGWHRMQALLTAWLPELLAPKTVPVRDGHIIAEEIRGRSRSEAESMTYTSFPCVSFGADLYWRGGWTAVAIGSGFFAVAYRLLSSVWFRYAGWASTWQILLLAYPATFLTMYPAGSIGETAWLWMWDLPKYVMLIGAISFITGKLNRNTTPTS